MLFLLAECAFRQRSHGRIGSLVEEVGLGAHGEVGFRIAPKAFGKIMPLASFGSGSKGEEREPRIRPDRDLIDGLIP